jgi:hypothetical protein
MRRILSARFLAGFLVYAVIVAVTLGFAFGGRYHHSGGETEDALVAASPLAESWIPSDGVTSATPNGGTVPEGEAADGVTAASPTDASGSYTSPDSTTGASPAPGSGTTPPPDAITQPSPAPGTTPPPDPGTTPPPDVITQPSPAPDPGTTPPPEEIHPPEEEDEEDASNLLYIFAPMLMFGMTFFGLSAFTRRRRKEDD